VGRTGSFPTAALSLTPRFSGVLARAEVENRFNLNFALETGTFLAHLNKRHSKVLRDRISIALH
jgi:hypothetical protein